VERQKVRNWPNREQERDNVWNARFVLTMANLFFLNCRRKGLQICRDVIRIPRLCRIALKGLSGCMFERIYPEDAKEAGKREDYRRF
jgi:hypothetical protein